MIALVLLTSEATLDRYFNLRWPRIYFQHFSFLQNFVKLYVCVGVRDKTSREIDQLRELHEGTLLRLEHARDYYENLPEKVIESLRAVRQLGEFLHYFKIDDDVEVDLLKLVEFALSTSADYAGSVIHNDEDTWSSHHMGKCFLPALNKTRKICPMGSYAVGPLYYLSRRAVKVLCDLPSSLFDIEQDCIFEDAEIGHQLSRAGIRVLNADMVQNQPCTIHRKPTHTALSLQTDLPYLGYHEAAASSLGNFLVRSLKKMESFRYFLYFQDDPYTRLTAYYYSLHLGLPVVFFSQKEEYPNLPPFKTSRLFRKPLHELVPPKEWIGKKILSEGACFHGEVLKDQRIRCLFQAKQLTQRDAKTFFLQLCSDVSDDLFRPFLFHLARRRFPYRLCRVMVREEVSATIVHVLKDVFRSHLQIVQFTNMQEWTSHMMRCELGGAIFGWQATDTVDLWSAVWACSCYDRPVYLLRDQRKALFGDWTISCFHEVVLDDPLKQGIIETKHFLTSEDGEDMKDLMVTQVPREGIGELEVKDTCTEEIIDPCSHLC